MKSLVELFLRRPVFTWVLVLGLVVLGVTGLGKMPIERFPNVDFAFVSVTITAPGMSAEQIESEIAQKVEGALGTVSGLDRLDAVCMEGAAVVSAQFSLEKSSTDAANDVRDRMARLADELPPTARPAKIETFNVNGTPIVLLGVTSASPMRARTLRELTELADTSLRRDLQSIRGVGEVRVVGGETRTLSIVLDPTKLASFGLTPLEARRALAVENLEAPGGTLPEGDTSLGVRLSAKARSAEEIGAVVVAKRGNYTVRISDVGRVEDSGIPADSRASLSGSPAVIVAVMKQPGANTVAVTDEVRSRLAAAQKRFPDGVVARVLQDNSEDVRASVMAVAEHLVIGAILAAAVVLLFLRSLRATLIAALAIPTSIIGTFAVARALGLTLNMLSLLGLTLAVGIVIDDAIVVLENIVRVMEKRGVSAREAAGEATHEIGLAVLATTLSLVAVFLPVAAMEGIVGRYLAPFSLTMAASILLSMAVAFTLTPMLCSRWLKRASVPSAEAHGGDGKLERAYTRALGWLVARKWVAGIGIFVTLVSIVPVMSVLPTTFLPVEDMARYSVFVRLPESASLDKTAEVAESIAALARTFPDVTDTAVSTLNARDATVTVFLGRRGVQEARILATREKVAARFANDGYLIMVGPTDDLAFPGPDGAAIQFVLRGGKDLGDLTAVAQKLLIEAKAIRGTVDQGLTSGGGRPELSISVNRDDAKRLGVSHADIGETLALADQKGLDMGSVRDTRSRNDVSIPVRLRVGSDTLSNVDIVRQLTVRGETGALVPLAGLATIASKEGPGLIRRVGRERQITLFMNTVPGTSDGVVVDTLTKKLAEVDPSGRVRGEVLGNAKEMEKAFSAFLVAIGLSFVFMYLILAAQFESWLHPITILVSLPLTVPFGLLSLLLGGQTLNLFSVLGFLVLFGVVKKNAILQVDRAIQLRKEGHSAERAIIEACRDRLRPILMTTLAFVAGMIPLVVSSGAGAATNRAIAVGILGGQSLSLALTLLATPIVYLWLDRSGKKRAEEAPAPEVEEVGDVAQA